MHSSNPLGSACECSRDILATRCPVGKLKLPVFNWLSPAEVWKRFDCILKLSVPASPSSVPIERNKSVGFDLGVPSRTELVCPMFCTNEIVSVAQRMS